MGKETTGIPSSKQILDGGRRELIVKTVPVSSIPAHSSTHEAEGADELDLTGLEGLLATAQTPASHGNEAHSSSFLTSESDSVVGAVTGIVKADGAGNISAAEAGVDYAEPEDSTSCKTIVPVCTGGMPLGGYPVYAATFSTNTRGYFYSIVLPFAITINKITIKSGGTVTTSGTIKIGVYSEDGQSKLIDVESPSIDTIDTVYTVSVSAVELPAGIYYVGVVSVDTANLQLVTVQNCYSLGNATPTGKPIMEGYIDGLTAGTLPSTITPASLTYTSQKSVVIRLDN